MKLNEALRTGVQHPWTLKAGQPVHPLVILKMGPDSERGVSKWVELLFEMAPKILTRPYKLTGDNCYTGYSSRFKQVRPAKPISLPNFYGGAQSEWAVISWLETVENIPVMLPTPGQKYIEARERPKLDHRLKPNIFDFAREFDGGYVYTSFEFREGTYWGFAVRNDAEIEEV